MKFLAQVTRSQVLVNASQLEKSCTRTRNEIFPGAQTRTVRSAYQESPL
jgi:hypothetical protein